MKGPVSVTSLLLQIFKPDPQLQSCGKPSSAIECCKLDREAVRWKSIPWQHHWLTKYSLEWAQYRVCTTVSCLGTETHGKFDIFRSEPSWRSPGRSSTSSSTTCPCSLDLLMSLQWCLATFWSIQMSSLPSAGLLWAASSRQVYKIKLRIRCSLFLGVARSDVSGGGESFVWPHQGFCSNCHDSGKN